MPRTVVPPGVVLVGGKRNFRGDLVVTGDNEEGDDDRNCGPDCQLKSGVTYAAIHCAHAIDEGIEQIKARQHVGSSGANDPVGAQNSQEEAVRRPRGENHLAIRPDRNAHRDHLGTIKVNPTNKRDLARDVGPS